MPEQSCVTLVDSIRNAIAAFPPEARQEDEYSVAKVTRLVKITQNLQQQVEELQAGQMPSTPPEMLEERRRASSEAAEKIREGEALCTKAADDVATIWGALLEDETVEEIRCSSREADEKINTAKAKMKKLVLQQKVTKNVEIKRLQQEVQTLHE